MQDSHKWLPLVVLVLGVAQYLVLTPINNELTDINDSLDSLEEDSKTYNSKISVLEQKVNRIDEFGSSFIRNKAISCAAPSTLSFGRDWTETLDQLSLRVGE